jgi:hypothetical protein
VVLLNFWLGFVLGLMVEWLRVLGMVGGRVVGRGGSGQFGSEWVLEGGQVGSLFVVRFAAYASPHFYFVYYGLLSLLG